MNNTGLSLLLLCLSICNSGCVWYQIGGKKGNPEVISTIQAAIDNKESRAILALNDFAWQLPICVRRLGERTPAYCASIRELIRKYPLRHHELRRRVIVATLDTYRSFPTMPGDYAEIVDKIESAIDVMGCVPAGPNKGVITIGVPIDISAEEAAMQDAECNQPISEFGRADALFGLMLGSAPFTPAYSASASEGALFAERYASCEDERYQSGLQPFPFHGGENKPNWFDQKKIDEAIREAERRKQEFEEAERKRQEAEAKREAAQEKQRRKHSELLDAEEERARVEADPNSTPEQKRAAAAKHSAATSESIDARYELSAAEEEEDEAEGDVVDAGVAYEQAQQNVIDTEEAVAHGLRVSDRLDDFVNSFSTVQFVRYVAEVISPIFLRYNEAKDCIERGCYLSCEEKAAVEAFEAELRSLTREVCNLNVTPLPDDDRCYDQNYGGFGVPEVTLVQAWAIACRELEKVSDIDCRTQYPPLFTQGFTFPPTDPCVGPLVMCGPDGPGLDLNLAPHRFLIPPRRP